MNEGDHHRGLVWPILVITAGVLLLLSNLGMLSLDLWELMLRGWPLILIAIGIDLLIGRRSVWGSIVAAVLIIAVLLLGLGLYSGRIEGGNVPSHTIEQSLGAGPSAGSHTLTCPTPRSTFNLSSCRPRRSTIARPTPESMLISRGAPAPNCRSQYGVRPKM